MSRRRRNHGHTGGNPPADEVLLTVHQVAENWRVSVRTVRRNDCGRPAPDHTASAERSRHPDASNRALKQPCPTTPLKYFDGHFPNNISRDLLSTINLVA